MLSIEKVIIGQFCNRPLLHHHVRSVFLANAPVHDQSVLGYIPGREIEVSCRKVFHGAIAGVLSELAFGMIFGW